MQIDYCLDTNSLINNPEIINELLNQDSKVTIPLHVILELDKLKKKQALTDRVAEIVSSLHSNFERISFLAYHSSDTTELYSSCVDLTILEEASCELARPRTIVTSDGIMQLLARIKKLDFVSPDITGVTHQSPSEKHTGFVSGDGKELANSFSWVEGKPVFNKANGDRKLVSYDNEVWKLSPKNVYQNLAMELLLEPSIDLVTLQSPAGFGKTMCALAAGLYLTLEKKLYDKIYVVKSTTEVDDSLGFLPGAIEDKIHPYFAYLDPLIRKLHSLRPANRIFKAPDDPSRGYDPKKFETLPLQYLRGMNIENAFVIIDETQNVSRHGIRTALTRLGNNVKCVCLGDVRQIDNENLNAYDNGLSWIVKKCLGAPNYAHLVMKGQKSRGPITDLILQAGV